MLSTASASKEKLNPLEKELLDFVDKNARKNGHSPSATVQKQVKQPGKISPCAKPSTLSVRIGSTLSILFI
jgi:hypothetical protein